MKFMCQLLLGMSLLPVVAATAAELKDAISFYAGFDRGTRADFARGGYDPQPAGQPKSVPGKFGNAIEFDSFGDALRYGAGANLNGATGTVACWVKELDGDVGTPEWNPFWQWQGDREVFTLGRQWNPSEYTAALWRDGGVIAMTGGTPECRVSPPGVWHHYAATWQRNLLRLFRDGVLAAQVPGADFYLRHPGEHFSIGRIAEPEKNADGYHTGRDLSWADPVAAKKLGLDEHRTGAFAIDELVIFDRALNDAEIALLAAEPVSAVQNRSVPETLALDLRLLPGRRALRVLPVGVSGAESAVEAHLLGPEGAELRRIAIPGSAAGPEFGWFDLTGLPPGSYRVRAFRGDPDRPAAVAEAAFELPVPDPWLGNRLGADDVVLPGFEPLRVEGNRVEVWGRSYDFDGSVFPARIVNQGYEVLAAPVRWSIRTAAGTAEMVCSEFQPVSASPTRAEFRGSGSLGPLQFEAAVTVEYDGFMKFNVRFTPPAGGVTVEDLRMRLEFPKEESNLFFYTNQRTCDWPKDGRMAVTPLETNGVITVGNGERCLQWLIESDQYYYPEDAPDAIQTAETADSRILDTVVIAAPVQLDAPIELEFALAAGPVKALPEHWRGWSSTGRRYLDPRLHRNIAHTYDWWARSPGETIPGDGFPVEPDPTVMAGIIPCASMHFNGYRATRETVDASKRTPEWAKYEAEWERIPRRLLSQSFPGWNEQSVDTRAASWGEWHAWQVNELFRTTGVRGLYYDDWIQGPSTNELAGSGYVGRDGRRRPTHDIFNQREWHRRVYALVHQYRGDAGVVKIHTSGSIYLPVVAFADVIYEGEIMCWTDRNPPGGNYFDTYRNDIFEMLLSGRQYGVPVEFHDISTGVADRPGVGAAIGTMAKQRQLWARLLLHDIQGVSGFTFGADELRLMWLDAFGIAEDDVEFTGYWRGPEETGAKLLEFRWPHDLDRASVGYISVYRRPGEALLIVVRDAPNNYAGASTAAIALDRKKLGLPETGELASWDMESLGRTPLGKIENDVLYVPVDVDNYAAVLVKAKE